MRLFLSVNLLVICELLKVYSFGAEEAKSYKFGPGFIGTNIEIGPSFTEPSERKPPYYWPPPPTKTVTLLTTFWTDFWTTLTSTVFSALSTTIHLTTITTTIVTFPVETTTVQSMSTITVPVLATCIKSTTPCSETSDRYNNSADDGWNSPVTYELDNEYQFPVASTAVQGVESSKEPEGAVRAGADRQLLIYPQSSILAPYYYLMHPLDLYGRLEAIHRYSAVLDQPFAFQAPMQHASIQSLISKYITITTTRVSTLTSYSSKNTATKMVTSTKWTTPA